MNTHHPQTPRHPAISRSAFTLVELVMVIAIIGILVGLAAAGIFPMLKRAKEAAISFEIKEIAGSIENFKTQYGFYPPSFERIKAAGSPSAQVAALLPYINRISPNHQEGVGAVGSRPIDAWWAAVGSQIEAAHGDDLVFWLSGLCANKQFPLTNGAAAGGMPKAYNDLNPNIQRDEFYEFKGSQLNLHDPVASYYQPTGPRVPFLYVDAASYVVVGAYMDDATNFANPKTFQLITYGMDGEPGNPGLVTAAGPFGQDNLCNFADGHLAKYVDGL